MTFSLRAFWPRPSPLTRVEKLRACCGALVGILLTGLLSRLCLGSTPDLPLLVAPMGASAVLLFAVPASPLAQPWPIIGGNVLSALVGISCHLVIADPVLAASVAVALAIGVMALMRCLHPPGGAVALMTALGGPAVVSAGFLFAVVPVGLNAVVLVAIGVIFNNLTRHSYPHVAPPAPVNVHGTADPPPQDRLGFTRADLDVVLARYTEILDVSREDLDALFRQVEAQAHHRLHGAILCRHIMSRDIVSIAPEGSGAEACALMAKHALRALPVLRGDGVVAGLITQTAVTASEERSVAALMIRTPVLVPSDTAITDLMPLLSDGVTHEVLITDLNGHLAGIITQTDLLAALYRAQIAEHVAAAGV